MEKKKKAKPMTAREKKERTKIRKDLREQGILPPKKKPLNRKAFAERAKERAYGLCENVRRRQHVGDGRRERLDRFRRRRKYRRQPKRRRRDDLDGRSGEAFSRL